MEADRGAFFGLESIRESALRCISENNQTNWTQVRPGVYAYPKRFDLCRILLPGKDADGRNLEQHYGIAKEVAVLIDAIGNGLPKNPTGDDVVISWSQECLKAMPLGASLDYVWHDWACWLLQQRHHAQYGLFGRIHPSGRSTAVKIRRSYGDILKGKHVSAAVWRQLHAEAESLQRKRARLHEAAAAEALVSMANWDIANVVRHSARRTSAKAEEAVYKVYARRLREILSRPPNPPDRSLMRRLAGVNPSGLDR